MKYLRKPYTPTQHPPESDLALYAGSDLARFKQWRTERHVRKCSACQQLAAEYSELRSSPAWHSALEGLNWNCVASETKANIRLGLAAGECVGNRLTPSGIVSGRRLVLAGGLLTVLIALGALISRPNLQRAAGQRVISGTVLEASESGIQVRGVTQTLRLMNPAARNVVYSVGSQGELRARSLDPETGNVAIMHVYGE